MFDGKEQTMKKISAVLLSMALVVSGLSSVVLAADSGFMHAMHQRFHNAYILDPDCDLVEPDQTLTGNYGWHFHIDNFPGGQVTSPTINVTSSLDPDLFPAVGSWPYEVSRASLNHGDHWIMMDLGGGTGSTIPEDFQTGYRVSRTTTDSWLIPPGGGEQEVGVTVTPVDERYDSEGSWTFMRVHINGNVVPDSNTQPEGANVTIEEGKHIFWEFPDPHDIGTDYRFTVRLQVQNPLCTSIVYKPSIQTYMEVIEEAGEATGPSISISDPSYPILYTTYSVIGDQLWNGISSDAWLVQFAPVSPPPVITVAVDIKPQSCPNPIEKESKGVLPVAILGMEEFDVTTVDPASVKLYICDTGEVFPLRWALEDVATPYTDDAMESVTPNPYACTVSGPDGYQDLTLKFSTPEVVNTLLSEFQDGDVLKLRLTAKLKEEYGGIPIMGSDVVLILVKPPR
jgi:hypothetical protein